MGWKDRNVPVEEPFLPRHKLLAKPGNLPDPRYEHGGFLRDEERLGVCLKDRGQNCVARNPLLPVHQVRNELERLDHCRLIEEDASRVFVVVDVPGTCGNGEGLRQKLSPTRHHSILGRLAVGAKLRELLQHPGKVVFSQLWTKLEIPRPLSVRIWDASFIEELLVVVDDSFWSNIAGQHIQL